MSHKKEITLSINPLYRCNFRCAFCYLTPEQLSSKDLLDLNKLRELLDQLKKEEIGISHIDLYGGEVGMLKEEYLEEFHQIISESYQGEVNVVTNLSKIHPYFLKDNVYLSVSYDFIARERHDEVFSNLLMVNKPISILMLASPELLKLDVDTIINHLNVVSNIASVEVKPYSSNQSNQLAVSDKEFEEFIKKWLTSSVEMNFEFVNEGNIFDALEGTRNAFSDDHVYITPEGKFAVLDFDESDHEYFKSLEDINEYFVWQKEEKIKVQANPFCSQCEYLGRCLTEHYRDVKSLENSCSGFKELLDWSNKNLRP